MPGDSAYWEKAQHTNVFSKIKIQSLGDFPGGLLMTEKFVFVHCITITD